MGFLIDGYTNSKALLYIDSACYIYSTLLSSFSTIDTLLIMFIVFILLRCIHPMLTYIVLQDLKDPTFPSLGVVGEFPSDASEGEASLETKV